MTLLSLDHLAVACTDLAAGAAAAEAALGVPTQPGGEHARFGTHNRLLSLGPQEYLEIIAINPAAEPPGRPRWFDLDNFAGAPRLSTWIAACEDLPEALELAPKGSGARIPLTRGDLRWQMAVPDDGRLPFDGIFPALIKWDGPHHPAQRLTDHGVRLKVLRLSHPEPTALRKALKPLLGDPRIKIVKGAPGLSAEFSTPAGKRLL